MDKPDEQPVIDEYHRQLELLMRHGSGTAARILSYAKLRIAANERLILLASGTLTITFSGAVALGPRMAFHSDEAILRPLLGAWRLLIFAIFCCIIANSREQYAASDYDSVLLATELQGRLAILKILAKKLGREHPVSQQTVLKKNSGAVHEKIALFLGWTARVATLIAFVLLYIFAKTVLMRL